MTESRTDIAIDATADALLAVCALQTGMDPRQAATRAVVAITAVYERTKREQEEAAAQWERERLQIRRTLAPEAMTE